MGRDRHGEDHRHDQEGGGEGRESTQATAPRRRSRRPLGYAATGRLPGGELGDWVGLGPEARDDGVRVDRPGVHANAHMTTRDLRRHCLLTTGVEQLLRDAVNRFGLSARGYHRILKIARTIADLAGADELASTHVREAIQYRSLDRRKAAA